MRARHYLLFLLLLATQSVSAQRVDEPAVSPWPDHWVTYELVPRGAVQSPMQTIVFELPVTEDYWQSVYVGQEVTSWFRTLDGRVCRASGLSGSAQWRLIVRARQRK